MDRFRTKQTGESYYVKFDFSSIDSSLTVSSATVSAKKVSDGSDVTATITTVAKQLIETPIVKVWVTAGSDGVEYQITCKATASNGAIYELEGLMLVADVPLTAETAGTIPGCVIKPTSEPISLAEAKSHLRVDDTADDEFITSLIQVARERVEDYTRRAIITQTWDYVLQDWPDDDYITLPLGNLTSVTSVKYKDEDGTETTLTVTTDYLVECNGPELGRIVLPTDVSWPTDDLYPSNPITIRYVCGWASASLVPGRIKAAIKMILSYLYEMRGEPVLGQTVYENNMAEMLLYPMRLWSF